MDGLCKSDDEMKLFSASTLLTVIFGFLKGKICRYKRISSVLRIVKRI